MRRPVGDNVGIGRQVLRLHVSSEHVDDVDDDGGDEGLVLEESQGGGGKSSPESLEGDVSDQANRSDCKHGDEGWVLVAVLSGGLEREGEEKLRRAGERVKDSVLKSRVSEPPRRKQLTSVHPKPSKRRPMVSSSWKTRQNRCAKGALALRTTSPFSST